MQGLFKTKSGVLAMDRNSKTFNKECTFSISNYFSGKYNTNYSCIGASVC
ncbi:hypothetical protein EMIT0180MI3_11962 [Priestia megaterium]